jgi:hypothetical protein
MTLIWFKAVSFALTMKTFKNGVIFSGVGAWRVDDRKIRVRMKKRFCKRGMSFTG